MEKSEMIDRVFDLIHRTRKIDPEINALIGSYLSIQSDKIELCRQRDYNAASLLKSLEDSLVEKIENRFILLDIKLNFNKLRYDKESFKEALSRFNIQHLP